MGLALRPLARGLGRPARVLSWLTPAGSVAVVVSYSASRWPFPWRYVWGSEVVVLALMGLVAVLAAVVAAVRRVRPGGAVVLLGLLLPAEVLGTVAFEYWPHGSLVLVARGSARSSCCSRAGAATSTRPGRRRRRFRSARRPREVRGRRGLLPLRILSAGPPR